MTRSHSHTSDPDTGVRRPPHKVPASLIVVSIGVLLIVGCGTTSGSTSGTHNANSGNGTAGLGAGTTTHSIKVDGTTRTFRTYRPAGLDTSSPVPLVVMLHGGFGNGKQAEDSYGWDAKADEAGFVVAYPDGLDRAWNVGGGCCGKSGKSNVNDVHFIDQVVAQIGTQVAIDPKRTFATGMSNGAMLTYRLACDSSVFDAIAPVSGAMLGTCPSPTPTSVLHIHGTADTHVRFEGGEGDGRAKIVTDESVPAMVAKWRAIDRCSAPTITTAGKVTTTSATCPDGREVTLIAVAGAGHQWPGGKSKRKIVARLLGSDQPSTAVAATDVIWSFFAAHPKAGG